MALFRQTLRHGQPSAYLWRGVTVTASLLITAATVIGCAGPPLPEPDTPGRVILYRGAGEIFSGGLDHLVYEMRRRGIDAAVQPSLSTVELSPADRPLVLGGHSVGADAAIRQAIALHGRGLPVAMLVLIDPFTPEPVPDNVQRVFLLTGRQTHLDIPPATKVYRYRLESDLPLLGGLLNQVSHLSITESPAAQQAILRRLLPLFGKAHIR